MTMHHFTREAQALTRRDAQARPATFNAQARTIEAVIATSTARVQRHDERGAYLEILDIAGADLGPLRGASVLDAHQQNAGLNAVIGTVEDAWREGDTLVARMRLSDRPELESLVRDIGGGVIRGVSVGYEITEMRDSEENGQRTRTAVKWAPREVSFVPVPADPNARTRSLPPPLPQPANRAAINSQIRSLGQRAGVGDDVVNDLVDRSASLEEARGILFDALLTRGSIGIRAQHQQTMDDPQLFVRAAGEGIFCRTNPGHTPSGPARQFVNMPLQEVARECLRRNGISTNGLYGDALVTRALGPLGGLMTTSDFGNILGDVVQRTLREAYTAAPAAIKQVARQTTASDFRTRSTITLDFAGIGLEKVNEAGEIKNAAPVTSQGNRSKKSTFDETCQVVIVPGGYLAADAQGILFAGGF